MVGYPIRRTLWWALVGVVLGLLGLVWDKIWHARQGDAELDPIVEIAQSHWLILLGSSTATVSLLIAAWRCRQVRDATTFTVGMATVGAVVHVTGLVWDTVTYIQGGASETANVLIYAGLPLLFVGLIGGLLLTRTPAERPSVPEQAAG